MNVGFEAQPTKKGKIYMTNWRLNFVEKAKTVEGKQIILQKFSLIIPSGKVPTSEVYRSYGKKLAVNLSRFSGRDIRFDGIVTEKVPPNRRISTKE